MSRYEDMNIAHFFIFYRTKGQEGKTQTGPNSIGSFEVLAKLTDLPLMMLKLRKTQSSRARFFCNTVM